MLFCFSLREFWDYGLWTTKRPSSKKPKRPRKSNVHLETRQQHSTFVHTQSMSITCMTWMVEIQQTPPFKFQFPYSHFSFTSSLPLQKTMLLRLPSPPLSSSFLSTTTPKHLRLFSSSSSPRPRPRRRRSLFRCAAGNDLVEVDAFTNKSGYLFELSNSDANSIEDYDISKIGAIYRRRPLILLRRLFQTGLTFGKWFAFRYIDNLMERSDQMFEVNL